MPYHKDASGDFHGFYQSSEKSIEFPNKSFVETPVSRFRGKKKEFTPRSQISAKYIQLATPETNKILTKMVLDGLLKLTHAEYAAEFLLERLKDQEDAETSFLADLLEKKIAENKNIDLV